MTTPVLPHVADDPESTFLKDNLRKKTYAEVTQDICMPDLSCDIGDEEDTGQPSHDSVTMEQPCNDDIHHSDPDGLDDEAWAIRVPTELKRKLAGLWQTSIILKIMGRPLGYQALQIRLAGIWRPTGMMHLIDIGYGYFIMWFDLVKDYQNALMNGPRFVGDQYLHMQAWEADFLLHIAKISTTAVWIHLENLPIEYYKSIHSSGAKNLAF